MSALDPIVILLAVSSLVLAVLIWLVMRREVLEGVDDDGDEL